VLGGFIVSFSVYRFLNISDMSPPWATYPGIVVLIIGIFNIVQGILSKGDSKVTRTLEIGIGSFAIVIGLLVEAFISETTSKLTWFISIFLIIRGVGFIATGITQSNKPKAIRIPKIIIGAGIIAILTGWFFDYHDLPISVLTILLSINLVLIGMEIIASAIGNKIVKKSLS
jgi:uncharacterized membrane protein HdeD (DUF308 family)